MDPRDTLSALKIDRGQEQKSGPRRHVPFAIPLLLIAALIFGAGGVWWWLQPHSVIVEAVTVPNRAGTAGATLNASGYVVAKQQATVAAEITGMVTAVYVTEGDRVAAGQILARLDDSAARATVNQAQSQLDADRTLPPEYQAQLVRDRRTLERTKTLVEADAMAETTLDGALAAVKVDEAELAHAIGQLAVDEKNLDYDRTQLSFTVIRSPFAGIVTERYAHPGEMISPEAVGGFTQTGICKVVDMNSLEIDVDVNEAYVERVQAGQKAEAVLDAYPDWTIPARVIGVVPTANQQKATVEARIAFDRLDPRILPQMGVQVRFLAAGSVPVAQIIRVPFSALHRDATGQYVLVVEDGHAVRRDVSVRPAGGSAIVRSGLDGGERVIVSGNNLKDGEEIREP